MLALSAPVIACAAVSLSALSRRSPFVAHLRVGLNGAPLWVWKLRTMWEYRPPLNSERGWVEWIIAEAGQSAKERDDVRVTSRFARFCRRHSIDELPQFWHLLRGEMSLIGPRPLTRTELATHYDSYAEEILSVKPGITGLWQTQGRSQLDWKNRVALDLEIVRTHSAKAYAIILIRTIAGLFSGEGAW